MSFLRGSQGRIREYSSSKQSSQLTMAYQIEDAAGTTLSFDTLYSHLRTFPAPLYPPGKARELELTARIASLRVHPSLEAALHLLNLDLPSAHFLVRHMAAAPAFEGMFLHGILHRVEGDYDNARAWYKNVSESGIFFKVWGTQDQGLGFIDRVEALVKGGKESLQPLETESARELETVIDWCVEKFGKGQWDDATGAWVRQSDKGRAIAEQQITGEAGGRRF
ncbi:MAG: hypothetical protein M4579_006044 [Chaenotheca gracillima]|nr:MAG: hypothetical protein M4579_006044 [Chaenotheca gracillima]